MQASLVCEVTWRLIHQKARSEPRAKTVQVEVVLVLEPVSRPRPAGLKKCNTRSRSNVCSQLRTHEGKMWPFALWRHNYVCLKEPLMTLLGGESMHEEHENRTEDWESAWLHCSRLRTWDQSTLVGWALNITSVAVFKESSWLVYNELNWVVYNELRYECNKDIHITAGHSLYMTWECLLLDSGWCLFLS